MSNPDDAVTEFPLSWIRWRDVGAVEVDEDGDLVFPPVGAVPGLYRFTIRDGKRVAAEYIGQAAVSLTKRFGLYRSRGRRPSLPLEKKTTSRNARYLLDALKAGYTVNVALVDDHAVGSGGKVVALDLTDRAYRSKLERQLIQELCLTDVKVLNRDGNPGHRLS
jgi:hypothetical protein